MVASTEAAATVWQQLAAGAVLGLGTVAGMVVRFLSKQAEPEQPKHMVLEQADLADMAVLRQLIQKYDSMLEIKTKVDNLIDGIEAVEGRQERMLEILGRMDRKEEMRALIREERGARDDSGERRR